MILIVICKDVSDKSEQLLGNDGRLGSFSDPPDDGRCVFYCALRWCSLAVVAERASDSLRGQSIDKAILRVFVDGPERRRDLRVSVKFGGTESTAQQTT